MITIKDKLIKFEGTSEEVKEELDEVKEIYGDITMSELIKLLEKKWKE